MCSGSKSQSLVNIMSARYSLDRESLQLFLANAFAVQNCGLDRESLCSLIELQRFTTTDDFDRDRALQMVADRALTVSNAGGVSIALLEGNELVYRAGSGSIAHDVGHHVPAVLIVSPEGEARREILRVENAQTDTRVEADVCRQFGANSLLMLPIYQNRALAGVMQVLFTDAHAFLDREMRTYRLMVGVVEERILPNPHRAQPQCAISSGERAVNDRFDLQCQPLENIRSFAIVPDAVEQDASQKDAPGTNDDRSVPVVRKSVRRCRAFVTWEVSAWSRGLNGAIWQDVDRQPNVWRTGAAVTVAMVMAVAIWSSSHHRPAPVTTGLASSTARDTGPQAPGRPLSLQDTTKQVSNRRRDKGAPNSAFRRVRIGPNEVDYIAGDVTIRYFKTVPARPQTLNSEKEEYFGDDVKVRYFAYTPTTVATPRTNSAATATTNHINPMSQ